MREAIYAFSGDPITKGHINIIERALQFFDRIIVGIGVNPKKKYAFSLPARLAMAKKALEYLGEKVQVISFEGLLVDFAFSRNVKTLIRGIRSGADASFELEMFNVNLTQRGIEVIPLFAKPDLVHVSSSAVKEIAFNQGNVVDYVPLCVKQAIEIDLLGQTIIGVTGEIGAGKTFVANKMCDLYNRYEPDFKMHNIDLDAIGRDLLTKNTEPFAVNMRKTLLGAFPDTASKNGFVDPKKVAATIFKLAELRCLYNEITTEPILYEVSKQMIGKKGVFLINSALLAEGDLTRMCNNNILMIQAPIDKRMERLRKRGYSDADITLRTASQMSAEAKQGAIWKYINRDNFGQIFDFMNDETHDDNYILLFIKNVVKFVRPEWIR